MAHSLYLPEECQQRHGAKPVKVVQQDWLGNISWAALRQQAFKQLLYALNIVLNVFF